MRITHMLQLWSRLRQPPERQAAYDMLQLCSRYDDDTDQQQEKDYNSEWQNRLVLRTQAMPGQYEEDTAQNAMINLQKLYEDN